MGSLIFLNFEAIKVVLCFQLLLTLLVNKLGDPDYKVASCASTLLTRLGRHAVVQFVFILL